MPSQLALSAGNPRCHRISSLESTHRRPERYSRFNVPHESHFGWLVTTSQESSAPGGVSWAMQLTRNFWTGSCLECCWALGDFESGPHVEEWGWILVISFSWWWCQVLQGMSFLAVGRPQPVSRWFSHREVFVWRVIVRVEQALEAMNLAEGYTGHSLHCFFNFL